MTGETLLFENRRIEQRLARLEAKLTGGLKDIGGQMLAARGDAPRPRRRTDCLEALAQQPGLVGRMARADLRINRVGESTAPVDDAEVELAQQMAEFYDNPLGFVLWSFEWSLDPALSVVPLPEPYSLMFSCAHGPELWACETFEEIGRQIRERRFDGARAVDAIRMATASGHGISKSATTAMLVNFIMSTRPNARGVLTASTATQLESKTWAEVQKWARRCITGHWWNITTGKGAMRMTHRERPESWRCDAQTAREENAESFAGLHAADSTPFIILDEASGVPDTIFETAQGGLTDGEPMMFAFGNPTRNTGWFHGAFNAQRHRWTTRQIDSRTVQITNKNQIAQWVEDFGEDSDFVKVRVRGVFPSASSLQFISRELVDDAARRELPSSRNETIVLGVDPARFGDDRSVIWTRAGRDARTWPPIRLRGVDTMTLAARVTEHVNFLRGAGHRVIVNVDGGGVGGGVIDRLRSIGLDVNEVQFGGRAMDSRKYANRRAEIWGTMRDWLAGGAIPEDEELATDLTAVEYGFNANDQIALERKESMKARGLASPDDGDALAITFAVPVPMPAANDDDAQQVSGSDYDPYQLMLREQRKGML